ncbi:MAG: hypothetical protein KDI46_00560 [Alphaproteobacteria bacterium]|nr:hypothetical protein [Alphaproteobacteria bacterium]
MEQTDVNAQNNGQSAKANKSKVPWGWGLAAAVFMGVSAEFGHFSWYQSHRPQVAESQRVRNGKDWRLQLVGDAQAVYTYRKGPGKLVYDFTKSGPVLDKYVSVAPVGSTLGDFNTPETLMDVWQASCVIAQKSGKMTSTYPSENAVYEQSRAMLKEYCSADFVLALVKAQTPAAPGEP